MVVNPTSLALLHARPHGGAVSMAKLDGEKRKKDGPLVCLVIDGCDHAPVTEEVAGGVALALLVKVGQAAQRFRRVDLQHSTHAPHTENGSLSCKL